MIDFGSACFEDQTVYTYIQSRFYRAPEVLLGVSPYDHFIDMWSLGCIAAELFLGLPLFPGTSEYNQLQRVHDMLGEVPTEMLERGAKARKYYTVQEQWVRVVTFWLLLSLSSSYSPPRSLSLPHLDCRTAPSGSGGGS